MVKMIKENQELKASISEVEEKVSTTKQNMERL
jgi:hypothetical protein